MTLFPRLACCAALREADLVIVAGFPFDFRLKYGQAIPKSAKNVAEAHEFLNNLLDPKVIAPISDFLGYPNPNKDGMPLVQSEIRDNPNLTPTAEAQKNLYVLQPLPQKIERIRTRVWSKVKTGN